MSLIETIDADYIAALKNRDTQTTELLRMLKSAIKNEAIKHGSGTTLDDQQVMAVLTREIKQRNDAASQYQAAGRAALAQKEAEEIILIERYLPKAMDEADLEVLVKSTISELQATQRSDMGKVMAALKQKLQNPADVSRAAALVQSLLV